MRYWLSLIILHMHYMMFWLFPTTCSWLAVPDITGSLPHPVQALHVHHDGPLLPNHPPQALHVILAVPPPPELPWHNSGVNPILSRHCITTMMAYSPHPLYALYESLVVPHHLSLAGCHRHHR